MPFISLLKCGLSRFAIGESGAVFSRYLTATALGLGLAAAMPFFLYPDVEPSGETVLVIVDAATVNLASLDTMPVFPAN